MPYAKIFKRRGQWWAIVDGGRRWEARCFDTWTEALMGAWELYAEMERAFRERNGLIQ